MRRAELPKSKSQLKDKAAKKIKRYHQGMDGKAKAGPSGNQDGLLQPGQKQDPPNK